MPSNLQGPRLELALARLPGRMRRGLKAFRRITGLTAVTSLAPSLAESGGPPAITPPIHPTCARRLRTVREPPCRKQWSIHSRSGRLPRVASHRCPLGLRCSYVPMHIDGHLVGVAKLVTDSRIGAPDFLSATEVLGLVVAGVCKETLVTALSGEVGAVRRGLADLQRTHPTFGPPPCGAVPMSTAAGQEDPGLENVRLVKRTLAFLQRHFQQPELSLAVVAAALGANPKYVTSRFTKIVGERMRTHIVGLRVRHACRLLLDTDLRVKEIACASGFNGPNRLASAFRRHVGVSPARYRRTFAGL